MALTLCPVCRDLYREDGEEACWRCLPDVPGETEPANSDDAAGAVTHWRESRERRIAEDASLGAVGSLEGLGFAPLHPQPGLPSVPEEQARFWIECFLLIVFGLPSLLAILTILAKAFWLR